MGQGQEGKGLAGHALKLLGKSVYAVGVAADRHEQGKCLKCGENPPAESGPAARAGVCKPCGKGLLGILLDLALDGDG